MIFSVKLEKINMVLYYIVFAGFVLEEITFVRAILFALKQMDESYASTPVVSFYTITTKVDS